MKNKENTICFIERFFLKKRNGGAEGDRTPDLTAASRTLSQLSYSPTVKAPLK
jgi:hypothetical protein